MFSVTLSGPKGADPGASHEHEVVYVLLSHYSPFGGATSDLTTQGMRAVLEKFSNEFGQVVVVTSFGLHEHDYHCFYPDKNTKTELACLEAAFNAQHGETFAHFQSSPASQAYLNRTDRDTTLGDQKLVVIKWAQLKSKPGVQNRLAVPMQNEDSEFLTRINEGVSTYMKSKKFLLMSSRSISASEIENTDGPIFKSFQALVREESIVIPEALIGHADAIAYRSEGKQQKLPAAVFHYMAVVKDRESKKLDNTDPAFGSKVLKIRNSLAYYMYTTAPADTTAQIKITTMMPAAANEASSTTHLSKSGPACIDDTRTLTTGPFTATPALVNALAQDASLAIEARVNIYLDSQLMTPTEMAKFLAQLLKKLVAKGAKLEPEEIPVVAFLPSPEDIVEKVSFDEEELASGASVTLPATRKNASNRNLLLPATEPSRRGSSADREKRTSVTPIMSPVLNVNE